MAHHCSYAIIYRAVTPTLLQMAILFKQAEESTLINSRFLPLGLD